MKTRFLKLLTLTSVVLISPLLHAEDDLKSILEKQAVEVQKTQPMAYPFSLETSLDPQQPIWAVKYLESNFAEAGNDLTYLAASGGGSEAYPIYLHEDAYKVQKCGGVGGPMCGQPTGEPEDSRLHQPLKDLQIDLAQIQQAATQAKVDWDKGVSAFITITSMRRLRAYGILRDILPDTQKALLKKLRLVPDAQAIVTLIENWGPGQPSDFLILDGSTGKILAKGKYQKEMPRPGAVSSGG